MITRKEVFEIARENGVDSAEGLLILFGPDGYDNSDGSDYDNTLDVLRQIREYGWDDEPEYQTDEPGWKFYGPSNPWDAPGMSVSDFI